MRTWVDVPEGVYKITVFFGENFNYLVRNPKCDNFNVIGEYVADDGFQQEKAPVIIPIDQVVVVEPCNGDRLKSYVKVTTEAMKLYRLKQDLELRRIEYKVENGNPLDEPD